MARRGPAPYGRGRGFPEAAWREQRLQGSLTSGTFDIRQSAPIWTSLTATVVHVMGGRYGHANTTFVMVPDDTGTYTRSTHYPS